MVTIMDKKYRIYDIEAKLKCTSRVCAQNKGDAVRQAREKMAEIYGRENAKLMTYEIIKADKEDCPR